MLCTLFFLCSYYNHVFSETVVDSSVVPLDFAEPIGAHVCDATITKNAKQYITQQEKHIITEHKFCFDLFKAFQCSETREVVRSAIKEKHGPTRVKVKLCCYGYKQVGDKCKFDEELHNARVRRTWMYIILCLTGFFVLIAIIFLILRCYLREKSRRKELEMLEHDPATFGPPRSGNHVARYVSNAQSIRLENPYQSSPPDRRTRNHAHSYSKGGVVRMSQLPDYHKWSIDDSQNEDEMYASIPDCDMKHSKYDPPPPYSPPTKELYPPNYLQLDKPGQSTSQPTTKDHYDSLKCEKKPLHSPPTKKKPLDDKDDGDSIENVDVVVYTDGATSDSPSNSSLINLDAGYQFMLPPKK